MKIYHLFVSLFVASFFFAGCATSDQQSGMSNMSEGSSTQAGSSSFSQPRGSAKTAYDGATGSGLLMERYKSGNIEGFRN